MNIPARIVQTAKTRDLHPTARAAVANLRLLHPGWEHIFFDDADARRFVSDHFPQHLPVFDSFPRPIQRVDFFRYLAVYQGGGFYFDLDVFLSAPLSPLQSHSSVFPFEELTLSAALRRSYQMDWEIGNYAFGARPGDPFLGAVIDNCVRARRDPAWVRPMLAGVPRLFRSEIEVLYSTGPGLVTRTLAEHPDLARSVTVLFPENVLDERHWHRFGPFGVHLMEGSWRTKGGYLRRRLACHWENVVRSRFMAESRRLGPKRSAGTAVFSEPVEDCARV